MSTSDTFTFLPKNTTDIFTLLSADALEKIGLFSMENTRKAIERLKEQKKNELTQLTAPSMANDDTVQVYRVEDIQNILQISRTAAYALVKEEPPFHVVRFGKSKNSVIRISKEDFDSWLNNPVQKNGGI
jgi:hypothetical protein